MKPLRWTSHVLQALVDRDIDRAEVEQTIAAPDHSVSDSPRRVLMRRYFDDSLQRQMLLRAVIEATTDERVVISAYKTS